MNNPRGVDDSTLKGAGNSPSSKEQTQLEDPATLAVPDPFKRKADDPSEPEQPTEAAKEFLGSAFVDIEEYVHMLEEEGELRGLVGPREMSRLRLCHVVNAATVLGFLPCKGQVPDIGSGAGLPGIVIAICRPDLDVHPVEPMQCRCEWLLDVVENLGLDNVTIHQARAEELRGKGQADVITARAVASMSRLIHTMTCLIALGGSFMALKGRRVAIEIEETAKELKSHHLRVEIHEALLIIEDGSAYVVVRKRQRQTGSRVRAKSEAKPGLTAGSELNVESPRSNLWRVAGRGRRRMLV